MEEEDISNESNACSEEPDEEYTSTIEDTNENPVENVDDLDLFKSEANSMHEKV